MKIALRIYKLDQNWRGIFYIYKKEKKEEKKKIGYSWNSSTRLFRHVMQSNNE